MLKTPLAILTLSAFFISSIIGPAPSVRADEFRLPAPGVMVHLSPPLDPPILKGIKVHPDNPFQFEFILDKGDSSMSSPNASVGDLELKQEATRLIKYFLASLTIPEKDLWVNLSPYEKDRIIPQSFGLTEMGRDLLAEDYMLKQITASLIYPEGEVGKRFWKRIYEEATKRYGTTNIPVNTFNKVWIVPEKAVVYENAQTGTAYVVESKLKVMLEQDYLSLEKHSVILSAAKDLKIPLDSSATPQNDVNALGSQIVREIVIPELTQEVNENKNFAQLRQVYNSLILATWYKKKIKDSILEQVYADKNKTVGVQYFSTVIPAKAGIHFKNDVDGLYQEYLKAFKKGVYNYIKEDLDPATQEMTPRKYFSGGVQFVWGASNAMSVINKLSNSAIASFAFLKPLVVSVAIKGMYLKNIHPIAHAPITLGQLAFFSTLVTLVASLQGKYHLQSRKHKKQIDKLTILPERPHLFKDLPPGNSLTERAQGQAFMIQGLTKDLEYQNSDVQQWGSEAKAALYNADLFIEELKEADKPNVDVISTLQEASKQLRRKLKIKGINTLTVEELREEFHHHVRLLSKKIIKFSEIEEKKAGQENIDLDDWLIGDSDAQNGASDVLFAAAAFRIQLSKSIKLDSVNKREYEESKDILETLINPLDMFVNHADEIRISGQPGTEQKISLTEIRLAKKVANEMLGNSTFKRPDYKISLQYSYNVFVKELLQFREDIQDTIGRGPSRSQENMEEKPGTVPSAKSEGWGWSLVLYNLENGIPMKGLKSSDPNAKRKQLRRLIGEYKNLEKENNRLERIAQFSDPEFKVTFKEILNPIHKDKNGKPIQTLALTPAYGVLKNIKDELEGRAIIPRIKRFGVILGAMNKRFSNDWVEMWKRSGDNFRMDHYPQAAEGDLAMISDTKIGRWLMSFMIGRKNKIIHKDETLSQWVADLNSEKRNEIENILNNISNSRMINEQRLKELKLLSRDSLRALINPQNYFGKSEEDAIFVTAVIGGGKPLTQVILSEKGKRFFSSIEGAATLKMFGLGIVWGREFNVSDEFVKSRLGKGAASSVDIYDLKAVNKVAIDNLEIFRENGFKEIHENMNQKEMNRLLVSITINELGQFRYNNLMGLFFGFPLEAVRDYIAKTQDLISFRGVLKELFPVYFKTLKFLNHFSGFAVTKNSLLPSMKMLENRYRGVNTVFAILDDKRNGNSAMNGGIDLTPANMNLQVKTGSPTKTFGDDKGSLRGIKFHLDPAMLAQLQNALGFTPVIINIKPMTDLPTFLGINKEMADQEA